MVNLSTSLILQRKLVSVYSNAMKRMKKVSDGLNSPFIFHNANAWEEGDEVILFTCRLENPDLDKVNGHQSEKLESFGNELYEMRFNMKTGAASQKQLSVSAVDFPRINESYTGRKQRYVYCTILNSIAKVTGIIKFDLHAEPESGKKQLEAGGNVCGIYDLGLGRFGSEAIFVPKEPGVTGEEDDGYLIFFVHDENTGKSMPRQCLLIRWQLSSYRTGFLTDSTPSLSMRNNWDDKQRNEQ